MQIENKVAFKESDCIFEARMVCVYTPVHVPVRVHVYTYTTYLPPR